MHRFPCPPVVRSLPADQLDLLISSWSLAGADGVWTRLAAHLRSRTPSIDPLLPTLPSFCHHLSQVHPRPAAVHDRCHGPQELHRSIAGSEPGTLNTIQSGIQAVCSCPLVSGCLPLLFTESPNSFIPVHYHSVLGHSTTTRYPSLAAPTPPRTRARCLAFLLTSNSAPSPVVSLPSLSIPQLQATSRRRRRRPHSCTPNPSSVPRTDLQV